jgi:hypothetical protein
VHVWYGNEDYDAEKNDALSPGWQQIDEGVLLTAGSKKL